MSGQGNLLCSCRQFRISPCVEERARQMQMMKCTSSTSYGRLTLRLLQSLNRYAALPEGIKYTTYQRCVAGLDEHAR